MSAVSSPLDGFQLLSGWLALIAGPVMFVAGAPKGWSCLVFGLGVALRASSWVIRAQVDLTAFGRLEVGTAAVGVIAIAAAVVYLTRTANDLPQLLPGYDADSGRVLVEPGSLALLVGGALLGRAVMRAWGRRSRPDPLQ